jgi:hypothetical protein
LFNPKRIFEIEIIMTKNYRMKTKLLFVMILAGLLIFASCTKYPNASDRTLEELVVLTMYDTKADFSQYSTFAISDSIAVISDTDSGRVMNSNTNLVVNQIVQNMTTRGYTRVAPNQNPDFGINVSMFKNTHVDVYYPGWYWGYPGYYPPDYYGGWYGYDYWYPYYPPVVTSYSTGTLQFELVDLKFVNLEDQQIYVRWTVFIRALLTGGHTTSEIQGSIDQAFKQTPQLTK